MPKASAGLSINLSGEKASRLLRTILNSLDRDYPDKGFLARRYIIPSAVLHGFSDSGRDQTDALLHWFAKLHEATQSLLMKDFVRQLLTPSTASHKIVSTVLRNHRLKFLQGSFYDTSIGISEFKTVFHKYLAERKLGEGGNGTVWQVRRDDNELLAMKVLSKVDIESTRGSRFLNELWFCARENHKNIIQISDWGLSAIGGEPFYIMPLLNDNLRKLIEKGIEPKKGIRLFLSALSGVEAAHGVGVWHRDIKPENLLYNQDTDELVVADFGIAHFNPETKRANVNTKQGSWVANRNYAAPEQRKKRSKVDRKADIFALGLILNEIFTGELPLGSDYRRIESVAPLYAHLDQLVTKMLSGEPANRPSIVAIREALMSRT